MTAAMLVGLLAGSGLVLLVSGLVPSPAPLADELAALHRRPALRAAGADDRRRISGSIGHRLVETVVGRRVIDRCATDLRVTGTTASAHLGQRAALALTGLLWAPLTGTLMWVAGADLGRLIALLTFTGSNEQQSTNIILRCFHLAKRDSYFVTCKRWTILLVKFECQPRAGQCIA